MTHRLAAVCLAAAIVLPIPVLAAPAAAPAAGLVGKTYDLAKGDDPVEAFAADGLSLAGASYEMRGTDGSRFRVDRAAKGRVGFVVVSRAVEQLAGNRARWRVTAAVPVVVDSVDAFTADCRAASGQISFLFYEADKSGKIIRKAEQGFTVDVRSGAVERAAVKAGDCRPGQVAAAPSD